jgi:hypothetical protein
MSQNDEVLRGAAKAWQAHQADIPDVSPVELGRRVERLEQSVRRRNDLEIGAAVVVIVVFSYFATTAGTTWSVVMNIEVALSALFISLWLILRGRNIAPPDPGAPTTEFVAHQRRQLERQIKLLSRVRYYYVLPIAVGVLGLLGERIVLQSGNPTALAISVGSLVLAAAFLLFVVWLNEKRAVAKLQRELEELPTVSETEEE